MCLITNQVFPLIAEEDITTYKVLERHPEYREYPKYEKRLYPLYYTGKFYYEIGKLFKTEIKPSSDNSVFDETDK